MPSFATCLFLMMTVFLLSELPNARDIFKQVGAGFTPFPAYYSCIFSAQSDQLMGERDLIYCIYECNLILMTVW